MAVSGTAIPNIQICQGTIRNFGRRNWGATKRATNWSTGNCGRWAGEPVLTVRPSLTVSKHCPRVGTRVESPKEGGGEGKEIFRIKSDSHLKDNCHF